MAKISLVKGGKTVNGKFVASGSSSSSSKSSSSSSSSSKSSSSSTPTVDYTKSASESIAEYNERILKEQAAANAGKEPVKETPKTETKSSSSSVNYEKSASESIDQYNARIAAEQAAANATPVTPTGGPSDALKNLSVGLAQGQNITQEDINNGALGTNDPLKELSKLLATQNKAPNNVVDANMEEEGQNAEQFAQTMQGGTQGVTTSANYSVGGNTMQSTAGNATTSPNPSSAPMQGLVPSDAQYVKIDGAYFQQTPGGLLAVSDGNIIQGLRTGQIKSDPQSSVGGGADRYVLPQPVTPATPTAMDVISNKFGLPPSDAMASIFQADPITAISDMTKTIFKQMGVDQADAMIKDMADELEDLENDRDDEIRDINDNPWLTEGVRLRQIAKVEEKYEDKINNRVNKLNLLESTKNSARQQAQFAIGTAISLYGIQQQQIQSYYDEAQRQFDNEIKLMQLAQPRASDMTSEMQEYVLSVEQGFQGTFLDYKQAIAAAGRAPGGGNGITPIQLLGFTNQVEDNFRANPAVQNFTSLVNFGVPSVIDELTQNPSSVNDTILMRTLAKITDPTTGVREGEYETFESATGAINRVFVLPKTWIGKGRLTDLGRQQMGQLVKTRFDAAKREYNNQYNYYNNQASQVGTTLPPPYQASQAPIVNQSIYTPRDVYGEVVGGGGEAEDNWLQALINSITAPR